MYETKVFLFHSSSRSNQIWKLSFVKKNHGEEKTRQDTRLLDVTAGGRLPNQGLPRSSDHSKSRILTNMGRAYGRTDGRTRPLMKMIVALKKAWLKTIIQATPEILEELFLFAKPNKKFF